MLYLVLSSSGTVHTDQFCVNVQVLAEWINFKCGLSWPDVKLTIKITTGQTKSQRDKTKQLHKG